MSTYGKLTVPTADVFKSQNNIASIDDNGKLLSSQLPDDILTSTSLKNSDLTVNSLRIDRNEINTGSGSITGNNLVLDIIGDENGIMLRSVRDDSTIASITVAAQESRDRGNIYITSKGNSGYKVGEINIESSDGNSISLGDNRFKLRSVFTTTDEGSEINLTQNDIKVIGEIQTTISNNTNKEEITVGVNGITLDSKNRFPISLKNATAIELVTQNSGEIGLNDGHLYMNAGYITLTSLDSGGIVLNGYKDAKLDLSNDQASLSLNNDSYLTFSKSRPVELCGGGGKPWLMFMSDGEIDLASEEGRGRVNIKPSTSIIFESRSFQFKGFPIETDPVYIKVPVVDSTTNKLDGTYARLYVSKNSSGALELKVEADS